MTGDGVNRRRVLRSLVIAGGTGAAVGTGTGALLSDRESGANDVGAGTLDVQVDGGSATGDGTVSLVIEPTADRRSGTETLSVSLPGETNNPATLWLGGTCPPASPLVEALSMTVSVGDCSSGSADVIASGSLRSVTETLADGVLLSACLDAGARRCLTVAWALADGYTGRDSIAFDLQVVAEQCRWTADPTNPFPGASCADPPSDGPTRHGISYLVPYACDPADGTAVRLGKLELESGYCGVDGIDENAIERGTYPLFDDGDDCTPTDYQLHVVDVVEKTGGEAVGIEFELGTASGDAPPDLCRVDVKGGPGIVTYDDPDAFDGSATDGPLLAPTTGGGAP
ncbi:hypothetical protein [Halovivax cerinus]|uniref:Uncharacterized protein n=1 Tax=Halovivax cerinus TaxID=1487865 RepID=A0ABD5NS43_9EURY|nr:hypothetical protein [Halovivax cerinus]